MPQAKKYITALFGSIAVLFSTPALASSFLSTINQINGLPEVSIGGASVMEADYVFWGNNWKWAGFETKLGVIAPSQYQVDGASRSLHLDMKTSVRKTSPNELTWDFDFNALASNSDVIGGGIRFRFNLTSFGGLLGEPEQLNGNRGWAWGRKGGTRIEMRFDPPVAKVYFERNQKNEIRVFFYSEAIPRGQLHHLAKLTLSSDISIAPSVAEIFGREDFKSWPTNILNWPIAPWTISPVDLSFLNKSEIPAGKRGFLRAENDKLIFGDGTTARFWGTNLAAWALFGMPRRDDVKVQAHRLSQLGFNLVRFTHHNSPWVNPNIFGDKNRPSNGGLDEAMLERLDWWIKCLEDEGIYVWLDLHVQRQLKESDNISYFSEISKGRPTADLKGYNYINQSIQEAMQRFNTAYVTHKNVYTGVAYKDDPGIATILITNENDVTNHFGNLLLPNQNVPEHNKIYMAEAAKFAATYQLPPGKTWRSWESGPSKIFLNDLEERFDGAMIRDLRNDGIKVPIVTTSTWGANPLSSLPALTSGDMIDVHAYSEVGELRNDPAYAATLVDWMAMGQVVDKPLSVSEWNISPFPAPDRHSIPLYVAGTASLQGWDSLLQFAYSQQALTGSGSPNNWNAFNDPALIATLPAAALLYRRGDVREATTQYVFAPTQDQLFNQGISAANSAGLRMAAEMGKLSIALPATPELPWLKAGRIPENAKVISDPNASLLASGAKSIVSDTGELARNWDDGIYTISTPRTQAATGFIGRRQIALPDVEINVATRSASVAVQSLDDKPINGARRILISLGARSVPSPGNKMPFHSEPVIGQLEIRAPAGLKLYRQHGISAENVEIPSTYKNGRYRIDLTPAIASYWMMLK
ncbi:MAG: cellulase family glycosylhydrolase [Hyphomicrobium sp.]|uniref:hypothetical protein n=1 Tax=Hyphomicrobium sp. TaxID=82 RepID=UPI0039E4CDB7